MIWKERTSPRRARAGIDRRVTSSPASRICPESAGDRPEIWWISVVLPAPFGPMMACSSFTGTLSDTSSVTTSAP